MFIPGKLMALVECWVSLQSGLVVVVISHLPTPLRSQQPIYFWQSLLLLVS